MKHWIQYNFKWNQLNLIRGSKSNSLTSATGINNAQNFPWGHVSRHKKNGYLIHPLSRIVIGHATLLIKGHLKVRVQFLQITILFFLNIKSPVLGHSKIFIQPNLFIYLSYQIYLSIYPTKSIYLSIQQT